jgi:hypothetical protein
MGESKSALWLIQGIGKLTPEQKELKLRRLHLGLMKNRRTVFNNFPTGVKI